MSAEADLALKARHSLCDLDQLLKQRPHLWSQPAGQTRKVPGALARLVLLIFIPGRGGEVENSAPLPGCATTSCLDNHGCLLSSLPVLAPAHAVAST